MPICGRAQLPSFETQYLQLVALSKNDPVAYVIQVERIFATPQRYPAEIRRTAVQQLPSARHTLIISHALKDTDPEVRDLAAKWLTDRDTSKVTLTSIFTSQPLSSWVQHEHWPFVRATLIRIGTRHCLPIIEPIVSNNALHPSFEVALETIDYLKACQPPFTQKILVATIRAQSAQLPVRRAALNALSASQLVHISSFLEDQYKTLQQLAAQNAVSQPWLQSILVAMARSSQTPVLIRTELAAATEHPIELVWQSALSALATACPAGALIAAKNAQQQNSATPWIRRQAAVVLQRCR